MYPIKRKAPRHKDNAAAPAVGQSEKQARCPPVGNVRVTCGTAILSINATILKNELELHLLP